MTLRSLFSAVLVLTVAITAFAQNPSGAPGVYIAHDPPRIGGDVIIDMGHSALPNQTIVFSYSDGYGPSMHPVLGPVWLDITSPAYQLLFYSTDSSGNFQLTVPLANDPSLFGTLTLFANAFMTSPSLPPPGWGLSKTVRLDYQTLDGWNPTGVMTLPRLAHSATSLAEFPWSDDSRVLIAGGGGGTMVFPDPSATTEFYNPMKREFEAGPSMAFARFGHRAVRLQDGRVLVTGGVYNQSGAVTQACEIYDPQTNLFTMTGSMGTPRTGHALTVLNDGRVLCSGGFSDWTNAGNAFVSVLSSAMTFVELYDPTTGTWSTIPQMMVSKRAGHTQTLLPGGQVLIAGGVNGGALSSNSLPPFGSSYVPTHTATCEVFQPGADVLLPTGPMGISRGWHGAQLLSNGSVLVTGGTVANPANGGEAVSTATCRIWNGSIWQSAPPLSTPVSFHTQTRSNFNDDSIIVGGYGPLITLTGEALSARHNGVAVFDTLDLGVHAAIPGSVADGRGFHTTTLLYDGSYLVCGGSDQTAVLSSGYTIVEN